MAVKAKQIFTVSTLEKAVVLWDTTLKPLCVQLNKMDPQALSYDSLTRKMKGENEHRFEFTTKSDVKYILQKFTR